jgi:DNA-directed RNA polymerase subunit RPC12/RpoP
MKDVKIVMKSNLKVICPDCKLGGTQMKNECGDGSEKTPFIFVCYDCGKKVLIEILESKIDKKMVKCIDCNFYSFTEPEDDDIVFNEESICDLSSKNIDPNKERKCNDFKPVNEMGIDGLTFLFDSIKNGTFPKITIYNPFTNKFQKIKVDKKYE